MGLKIKIEEKALNVNQQLTMQAQMKYVQKMAKDEGVDFTIMWEVCTGDREYEDKAKFSLGFKLADPAWMIALFKQLSKKKRRQAAENFAMTLNEEEAGIFWSEVFNEDTAGAFKEKWKEEKKRKGADFNDADFE